MAVSAKFFCRTGGGLRMLWTCPQLIFFYAFSFCDYICYFALEEVHIHFQEWISLLYSVVNTVLITRSSSVSEF